MTLNVGRVMTPTLGMVVLREAAISAFVPESFYTVQITVNDFTVSSERFKGKQMQNRAAKPVRKRERQLSVKWSAGKIREAASSL